MRLSFEEALVAWLRMTRRLPTEEEVAKIKAHCADWDELIPWIEEEGT